MPGDRTCSGGAYTFQIPGPLAAQDKVAIPLKVQNAASIRCAYAYLQQGTSDGQSAYVVKYSSIRPSIWPTAVLVEGNDLAFDIKAVASPDAGSDLTVVIQT